MLLLQLVLVILGLIVLIQGEIQLFRQRYTTERGGQVVGAVLVIGGLAPFLGLPTSIVTGTVIVALVVAFATSYRKQSETVVAETAS